MSSSMHQADKALRRGIKGGRQTPSPVRRAISVGAVLAVLAAILGVVVNLNTVRSWFRPAVPELYRIRVTVLDPGGSPADNAKVWSSLGGEAKKVAAGWEFNVPRAAAPKDGQLTVFASRPSAFELVTGRLRLALEPNPTLTLRLQRDLSAQVRGIIVDASNRAIAGARIYVVGFELEATASGPAGGFGLPAHAADGQQVQLHVEKRGYIAVSEFHPAGHTAVTIVLDPAAR